jgi:uncharacterized integral membrane protein
MKMHGTKIKKINEPNFPRLVLGCSFIFLQEDGLQIIYIYIYIYLLTAIGLSPGSSSTVHIYTKTIHRTTQQFQKSAGRAPS